MARSLVLYLSGLLHSLCYLTLRIASSSGHELLWPRGRYALPKAKAGCPSSVGFFWETGFIFQDTEDTGKNEHSAEFHLEAYVNRDVKRDFCVKNDPTLNRRTSWPKGRYCVYMKGKCSPPFSEGWATWDDEDTENKNKKSGTLPSGEFSKDTRIHYCCRKDGDLNSPIDLPTKTDFYLLPYLSAKCQQVKWAVSNVEFIRYAVEKKNTNHHGSVAYGVEWSNRTEHFCHYKSCNHTLTERNGVLMSSHYPHPYPHGQHCSWRIIVDSYEQVTLTFEEFDLENSQGCAADAVTVFDGEDETAPVLGQFCGGILPPLNGISSSGHKLLVIFKSDGKNAFKGFKATYASTAVRPPPPTTTPPPTVESTRVEDYTDITSNEVSLQVESSEDTKVVDNDTLPVWVPIVIVVAFVILLVIILVIVLVIYLVANQRCHCSRHGNDARKRTVSSTISENEINTV